MGLLKQPKRPTLAACCALLFVFVLAVNSYDSIQRSSSLPLSSSQPSFLLRHRSLSSSSPSLDLSSIPPSPDDDLFDNYHPPLFPLQTSDYVGLVFSVLGLLIAAGGGIGGGGILVPIFILVMHFSPKHAIPLSNVTVLGGGIANCILNAGKRHPRSDAVSRPLVDWDIILVMEPLTIAGALLGAMLNKVLPETLLAFMLVLLLLATAYSTIGSARKLYAKETDAITNAKTLHDRAIMAGAAAGAKATQLQQQQQQQQQQLGDVEMADVKPRGASKKGGSDDAERRDPPKKQQPPTGKKNPFVSTTTTIPSSSSPPLRDGFAEDNNDDGDDGSDGQSKHGGDVDSTTSLLSPSERSSFSKSVDPELATILREESDVSMQKLLALMTLFVVVLVMNVLKGGGSTSPLGIECGSKAFWLSNLAILAWILFFMYQVRVYLVDRYALKERVKYRYLEGDMRWSARSTVLYPCICFFAGFFAGMFGVGGGIVKAPLMLAMGVHPAVASATSATMILFTSFTATTSFFVYGLVVYDYSVVCFIVGFLSTYAGQVGLNHIMKNSNRNSYIAFSIGGVVLLSAFMMGIEAVISLAENKPHPSGGLCGK